MNYNKKIIIAAGIFFFILLLGLSIIHITINFMYPGNELADSIKESFKDSFGKSIKFDSLIFKYNGDIILQNFYLSNTTDFNDNVNLIKCSEVVVDTSLIDLISRKVTFSAVEMYEPDINIIKNYGKSYYDTFISDIIIGIKNERVRQFITNEFSIKLKNSKLFYKEIFKNSKTSIDLYDVDLTIDYDGHELYYDIDGNIINRNISRWRSSDFEAEGTILLDSAKSENSIEFNNIDFSIINNLLAEKFKNPATFTGELSGDISFKTDNGKLSVNGELNGDEIYATLKNDSSHYLLRDEEIDIKLNMITSRAMDQITINELVIDNDALNLIFSADYRKDDFLSFAIESNKIDLDDLSDTVSPFPACRYNGELKLSGKCSYNLKEMKPDDIALDIKLYKFNLIPSASGTPRLSDITGCNAIISADKNKVTLKTMLNTGKTDLDISFNSKISEWNPFKSQNQLEIYSKKIDLSIIKYAVMSGINTIYNMAYVDMFQNFDEQRNFLKEPEGIFINNNDLMIKINAEKLIIANNSALSSLALQLNLEKGNIKTDLFSIEGYEGIFSFNAYASLRQDYPFMKIEGGVKDLNLTQLASASDSVIQAGGIMSFDFSYETNAFRVGQIVENGKAGINLSIKDGYFSNTDSQKILNKFIKENGYSESLPEPLTFSNFTFSFNQSANEYYIRNFSLSGDKCSFSAYGKYLEDEGLSIPVNINFNSDNLYTKVPLIIFGTIMTPCVKINEKKNKNYTCF